MWVYKSDDQSVYADLCLPTCEFTVLWYQTFEIVCWTRQPTLSYMQVDEKDSTVHAARGLND